jgi:hypothetical protein
MGVRELSILEVVVQRDTYGSENRSISSASTISSRRAVGPSLTEYRHDETTDIDWSKDVVENNRREENNRDLLEDPSDGTRERNHHDVSAKGSSE